MSQRLDAGLHFDEGAELRDPRDGPGHHLPDLIRRLDLRPWIVGSLLQSERDLLLCGIDLQDLDRDVLTWLEDLRRIRDPRPPHFGDVQQTLHCAAKIDERTELSHRRDAALQHGPGDDGLFHLGGRGALFFWEKCTPGHDEIPAAFLYSLIRNV